MFLSFTIIAIGSAFFAAIANIIARSLLKNLSSRDFVGINFLTMGATMVLVSPFFYHFQATIWLIIILAGMALVDTLANYLYFKTFENTEAIIATPILSLIPAFTFFFSWIILKENTGWQTYLICLIIILAVVFFSVDFKNFSQFKKFTLVPAISSAILFGLTAIPLKILLSSGAINSPTLYMYRAGFIALFSLLFFKFPLRDISTKQYWTIFARGLFVIAQYILLYFAINQGNTGVALTLGNITPVFVFILGIIFLHEKPTIKKALTATLILILSLII
ncbi:MAG: DMT family transporter [Candidatus Magasanikbacteria bacterium]